MKEIHLKTTFVLSYIFGFALWASVTAWLLSSLKPDLLDSNWGFIYIICGGISGVLISKETFVNALDIQDSDPLYKKAWAGFLAIATVLWLLIPSLFSYVVLAPLYFVYCIGYLFGKGFRAAKND